MYEPRLILNFLSHLALKHDRLGQEDKGNIELTHFK